MKINYKGYLIISIVLIIGLIILVFTKSGYDVRPFLIGGGIGAGFRSLYEYFKEQKKTPEKK